MELWLEILDGDAKGSRIPVGNGFSIGRRGCDLTLQDSKISSRHAAIEMRSGTEFWLVDLGSSNGIKVQEKRVRELLLIPGQIFTLGRTRIRVAGANAAPKIESTEPQIVATNTPAPSWWDGLLSLIERGELQPEAKREIAAFESPLQLRFTRGPQSGEIWTIGYGPREIGSGSVDLTLEEPGLPRNCFRLMPVHEGALLKVSDDAHGDLKLNGRLVESEFLRDGDVIEIKNTRIEVSFRVSG